MTRRSPLHQRYQSKKPKGQTTKSAAAAKPSRGAGKAGEGKKAAPKSESGTGRYAPLPQTPEAKRLRRIWWALVGTAMALAVASVFVKSDRPLIWWPIMIVYAISLGGAMYLEFFPLRKMRREAEEERKKAAKAGKGR